jgi:hypothetical protein
MVAKEWTSMTYGKSLWRFDRIRSAISVNSLEDGHITEVAYTKKNIC